MKTIKTTSVELIIEEGVVQGFYYREGSDVKMYVAKRANTEDIGRLFGKKAEDSITIFDTHVKKNISDGRGYIEVGKKCHSCACFLFEKGSEEFNGVCGCECHKK